MNNEERTLIDAWVERLVTELGQPAAPVDVDAVLNLAGSAARTVTRPAAPLTTFIVGFAAGHAAATGVDASEAMRQAIIAAEKLAASIEE